MQKNFKTKARSKVDMYENKPLSTHLARFFRSRGVNLESLCNAKIFFLVYV